MSARTMRSLGWRTALLTIALLVAALVPAVASADGSGGLCGSPGAAEGPCGAGTSGHRWVHPWAGFQGWGYVVSPSRCPEGAQCIVASTTPAWRWNGSWQRASLAGNQTPVYIYPYATGWSWVWTQTTGWLAVQDSNVYAPTYYLFR